MSVMEHTAPLGEHMWTRVVAYRLSERQAAMIAERDETVVVLRADMAMLSLTPEDPFCWLCEGHYPDVAGSRCPGEKRVIV